MELEDGALDGALGGALDSALDDALGLLAPCGMTLPLGSENCDLSRELSGLQQPGEGGFPMSGRLASQQ